VSSVPSDFFSGQLIKTHLPSSPACRANLSNAQLAAIGGVRCTFPDCTKIMQNAHGLAIHLSRAHKTTLKSTRPGTVASAGQKARATAQRRRQYRAPDPRNLVVVPTGMCPQNTDKLPGPWAPITREMIAALPQLPDVIPHGLIRAWKKACVRAAALALDPVTGEADPGLTALLVVMPKLCICKGVRNWQTVARHALDAFPAAMPSEPCAPSGGAS
jgi:hypothetical protein